MMSEKNGYVTPEQLFGRPKSPRYADVEVRGMKFRLQSWSASEAARFAKDNSRPQHQLTVNERLIVRTCVDGEGKLMFTSEQVSQLAELDAALVAELAQKCLAHVGLSEVDDDEKN